MIIIVEYLKLIIMKILNYINLFFNLSIQIDEYNKLIELVINEIITKYIIIIRSKYDVDTLIKNNFNLLKENEILKRN